MRNLTSWQSKNYMLEIVSNFYHLILQKLCPLLNYYVQDPQDIPHEIKKTLREWWVSFCGLFTKLIVLFCTTTLFYALLLYFIKYLWFTYQNTYLGDIYISSRMSPLVIALMHELDNSILVLSFTQCKNALIISFSVGLFVQFFAIRRYFYDAQGWLARLSWAFGLSILAGYYGGYHTSFMAIQSQVILLFIPVCCLVDASFSLAQKFLPEITYFFQIKKLRKLIETAHIRNTDSRDGG